MRIALEDRALEDVWVVYPGHQEYSLDDRITVMPVAGASQIARALQP